MSAFDPTRDPMFLHAQLTEARAELSRIRTLLDDRPAMTQFIVKQIPVLTTHYAAHVADKLRDYLLSGTEPTR